MNKIALLISINVNDCTAKPVIISMVYNNIFSYSSTNFPKVARGIFLLFELYSRVPVGWWICRVDPVPNRMDSEPSNLGRL